MAYIFTLLMFRKPNKATIQVNIWDTWTTLNNLNINDYFHLKDLEISEYKRESKGRWPIKNCRFIFVNCCLIWLSKH
jgi:hypothetical protein